MIVIQKEEYNSRKNEILSLMENGKIFIYPTDTIYGIGCDATNDNAVLKVREIKERPEKPFSIIAPSKEWIKQNCVIGENEEEWLGKLPGPYTLILKLNGNSKLSKHVNPDKETLGVRIPNHWIAGLVAEYGKPIITPSANISGQDIMTSMDDLHPQLKSKSHVILYEGERRGQPSTIVNLAGEDIMSSKRKII